jgi:endonuclease/exonuclease/phosphatase family metal-dependent hydrolase
VRKPRPCLLLPLALALGGLLAPAPARADVVTLNSGVKIEGTVVGEDGEALRIELRSGVVTTVYRHDIARVERFATPAVEFARRKAALEADRKATAAAWYDLGLWALEKKLAPEAKTAFEKTIVLDPDHAAARDRLGYEHVGREWLTHEQAQTKKGLVEYDGRWVRPDEKEKLEQGYVQDADGQWVKREVADARKAAEADDARRAHDAEIEGTRRASETAAREKADRDADARAKAADPAPRRAATASLRVKVVQFNIAFDFEDEKENRWARRAPLVAGLLEEAGADVACIQEDKQDQVDDLRRLLPGWDFVGKGRNGGLSEHCSVAFDTARWRCAEHGDFWLSDTPDVVASNTWGTKYPHKVTWARLEGAKDPDAASRDVLFLSTHLDEHKDMGEVREKSARVIRTWLGQHAADANVVVCGDFNAGTEERPHEIMLAPEPGPRLTEVWDALRRGDPNTGTCHEYTGKARKKRIDWIFCAGNLTPVEIKIDRWNKDGHYPSDHFALAAELEVGPRPKKGARRAD